MEDPDDARRRGSAPAELFRVAGTAHRVGIIAAVSKPFCGTCDRVRLTADGQLRNCLFSRTESDLRGPLRSGVETRNCGPAGSGPWRASAPGTASTTPASCSPTGRCRPSAAERASLRPGESLEAVDDTYRDPSRPIDERVEALLRQLTLSEKAGLFFHRMIGMGRDGELADADPTFGSPSTEDLVVGAHHDALQPVRRSADPAADGRLAQQLAGPGRLDPARDPGDGIHRPAPRLHRQPRRGASTAGPFSQWPEPLGLAAIGDEELVERFADIARQEYLAVGIRVALHPQIDLATEPRWARRVGTFGEDAELSGRLGRRVRPGLPGRPSSGRTRWPR